MSLDDKPKQRNRKASFTIPDSINRISSTYSLILKYDIFKLRDLQ